MCDVMHDMFKLPDPVAKNYKHSKANRTMPQLDSCDLVHANNIKVKPYQTVRLTNKQKN